MAFYWLNFLYSQDYCPEKLILVSCIVLSGMSMKFQYLSNRPIVIRWDIRFPPEVCFVYRLKTERSSSQVNNAQHIWLPFKYLPSNFERLLPLILFAAIRSSYFVGYKSSTIFLQVLEQCRFNFQRSSYLFEFEESIPLLVWCIRVFRGLDSEHLLNNVVIKVVEIKNA